MQWLVDQKDFLQALAAVANVLASFGLLAATAVYVCYTRTISRHAGVQAKSAMEQAAQAARVAETQRLEAEESKAAAEAQRRESELRAAAQYFLPGDSPEQQAVRRRVWNANGPEQISNEDASQVASYWHFWGMMVRRGLLPLWVFEGSSGVRVKQYFEKLTPFVEAIRRTNPFYASEFEWLANRVSEARASTTGESQHIEA